jgi:hypothetical protein
VELSNTYNLKIIRPEIAKQWHPAKNGTLTPDNVTPGSGKRVWWICDKGHEWQTAINNRANGNNCPYCSGRRASKEYNISVLQPGIAKQWHPVKNGNLTPDKFRPASNKKVWWLCHKGHEWQALIINRCRGDNCPYCSGKRASKEYNLSVIRPELAKQWHPTKNGGLTPDKVTPGSGKIAWWICDKGHEWQASIRERNSGRRCIHCFGKRPSKKYNFSIFRVAYAKEWHPVKNGNLTPDKVRPASNKKVWWLCHKGHEWQANIYSRYYGSGCPYCSGRKASKEYNLSITHPQLAGEWHPFLNGKLKPGKVTPGSGRKVWWLCDKEHEWQELIYNRCKGNGCPYCAGKKASKEYNLSVIHPGLAKQWHPVKNRELKPEKVTPASEKKVWWVCKRGHEWRAVIASRSSVDKGCPYCAGRKPSQEYNLSVVRPDLAKQWHPVRNGYLTPDKVTPGTHLKVWWICDRGHEWQATISHRSKKTGCAKCASNVATNEHNLMIRHPDIAHQWHPTRNGYLTPEKVTHRSIKKVWWMCDKGHEWEDLIIARTKYGNACPRCYGIDGCKEYNLLSFYPDIAGQWHHTKNGSLTPEDVTPGSGLKVWWVCDKGHEWLATVDSRTLGTGCPYCARKKKPACFAE